MSRPLARATSERARERPEQPREGNEERDDHVRLHSAPRWAPRTMRVRLALAGRECQRSDLGSATMPTYEYRCAKCGRGRSRCYQSFSDKPLTKHDGLRRQARQGALAGRDRAEGLRLLQDRQPQQLQEAQRGRRTRRTATPSRRATSELLESTSDSGSSGSSGVLGLDRARPVPPTSSRRQVRLASVADGRDRRLRRLGLLHVPRRRRRRSSVDTPFGAPSAPVAVGTVGGRRVAFLPRHGQQHTISPARIPQRANLWAMRSLGVRTVVGPCAVGSLRPTSHPGDFVVLDQLVDRTRGRADTFYDGDQVHHVSFADPVLPGRSRRTRSMPRHASACRRTAPGRSS